MADFVRVLVVDDSAYVRKVMRQMLSRSPFVEVVGAATNGEEALELVEQLRPDVVTLDLTMPRMGGIEFLQRQMALRPLPVVVVSIASESGEQVMQAFNAGAVDVVRKPTALATEKVLEIAEELIGKVRGAAKALVRRPLAATEIAPVKSVKVTAQRTDLVVIGVSTGGPQALKEVIGRLPHDFPVPIAVVLHMPPGFTELFARSLASATSLAVSEAQEGDLLRAGMVLIAPAGYHLHIKQSPAGTLQAHLDLHPSASLHRPAVDVLFRSAAEAAGDRVLAVVLTGMGNDGTAGAGWVKAQGGRVLTEAESSCVVYGMPRSIVEAGLSDASIPLPSMAAAILEAL
jgi:two-component system, chemotaxis family, protein-glutamate methylesterase/glutaminase